MTKTARFIRLVLFPVAAACAPANTPETSAFAGSYTGRWVAINDSTDHGTSEWTVSPSGQVSGIDNDLGAGIIARIEGLIDGAGNLSVTAAPGDSSGAATLKGTLIREGGNIQGLVDWDGKPPTSYQYILTRTK